MHKQHYACDDVVFKEDARSDEVCRIISGHAELTKRHGDQEIVVGHVGPGEFVGEMSVIEGRRRSATLRATSDLDVELIDREELLRRISRDKWLAFHLLVRLSERLGTVDRDLAVSKVGASSAKPKPATALDEPIQAVPDNASIRILPRFRSPNGTLPRSGLQVDHVPFTVGRKSVNGKAPILMDLLIEDARPYRLSRAHFAIVERRGGFVVHDLDSSLGTAVNGQFVGRHFATDYAPLKPGRNEVVAGGASSPFQFRIELQRD